MKFDCVPLTDYFDIVSPGVKPFKGNKNYVATGSLETGKITSFEEVTYESRPSRANMETIEDDLLFAKMKGTEKAFIISKKDTENIYSTGFSILRIKNRKEFEPKFIYYWLRSENFQRNKNKEATGATQKAINEGKLAKFNVPKPPLEIQKKIVATLEKVQKLIELRQDADKFTAEFLKSAFYQIFGDPAKNNKKWNTTTVISVCDCIVPGRDKPKSFSGEIPWINTEDLNHLSVTEYSIKKLGLTETEINQVRAKIIPENSVLITCVGDLGKVSIAGRRMVINQQLHSFQCSNKINPVFLMYILSFQKQYMYKMANSTTLPYMNKTVCNNIPIILPPIELQKEFAKLVYQIENLKIKQAHSGKQTTTLFEALIQQAFAGELIC